MIKIIFFVVLLLFPSITWAFDIIVTGTEVTATYDEPVTNANGSPLIDLNHTTLKYDMNNVITILDIPATSPTGGGTITQIIIVPVAIDQEVDVPFWVTATDTSGNESADSNIIIKRIDRLSPSPPN